MSINHKGFFKKLLSLQRKNLEIKKIEKKKLLIFLKILPNFRNNKIEEKNLNYNPPTHFVFPNEIKVTN